MRRFVALTAFLFLAIPLHAQVSGQPAGGGSAIEQERPAPERCGAPVTTGPDVAEIDRLERRGAQVNVEGWGIEEARAFFAPEWVSVQPDGSVTPLAQVFDRFPNGRSQAWAASFTLTELDIRVYCDVAIVIGLGEAQVRGAAQNAAPLKFRFLNVWRRQDGRWLYAANQFVRL